MINQNLPLPLVMQMNEIEFPALSIQTGAYNSQFGFCTWRGYNC